MNMWADVENNKHVLPEVIKYLVTILCDVYIQLYNSIKVPNWLYMLFYFVRCVQEIEESD